MINLRKYRIQGNLHHFRIVGVKFILILSASFLLGCSSFGPKTIPTDQFNFNNAINEASSEQLLLNMVRLR